MKLACPKCYQATQKSVIVQELHKYVDQEGYVAAQVLCPSCGFTAAHRVIQESPPCSKCGHIERRQLKGNAQNAGIVAAPTDPNDVLTALRNHGEY